MRSIWKGSLSFGLVSIPVQLYGATENHSVSFHQIHLANDCGGRIRYRKVCEIEEVEVPPEEIGKGFKADDGTTVPLTDEDLSSLPLPTAKTIEILSFVPASEIDPIQLDRAYYLATDHASAAKPYVLLRSALTRTGKAAVAKFALRGRESLGLLRVVDDTLVLHSMLWPDEVRSAGGLAPAESVTVRDAELDLAETLMDSLGDLEWEDLHDEYREAVEELVTAKQEGRTPEEPAAAPTGGKVIDLMAALESSVAAAREARGGDREATVTELSAGRRKATGEEAEGGERKPAKKAASSKKTASTKKSASAKKTAEGGGRTAKKTAAKKTAAKKTGAKKTTAKKTTAAKKTASRKRAS
ncbi:non-homologous end joining protein Ku [Streptomyces alkaliterrae]|uniref:Non-homologous end joining protein Ku n=1 Tax=Streptomyces alkaliterrae TaxID=2213162 RepID=A0A5P0YPJ4_9ACTN|nr:Ku protein [Streptomyces alkaliterrae]MBB1254368.1 Ku protein [Streptomyces alkaliterrae]MBB1258691.1 Ku protein [Streptomyces alkaliterrae]MQS02175.1 Ku protein [Streptomyces alkaliterrae]